MEDDNIVRKHLLKSRDKLPRQGNLRHKHDHLTPRRTHGARRLDVDTRLAAARHPVEQIAMKRSLRNARVQLRNRRPLRLRQFLGICPRRPRTIAGAQSAPQVLGQISGYDKFFDYRR